MTKPLIEGAFDHKNHSSGPVGGKVTRADVVGKLQDAKRRIAGAAKKDEWYYDQLLLIRCLEERLASFDT